MTIDGKIMTVDGKTMTMESKTMTMDGYKITVAEYTMTHKSDNQIKLHWLNNIMQQNRRSQLNQTHALKEIY